jgi:hypothetical protein
VPGSATIPANSDTATVLVSAVALGSTVIHASYLPYIPDASAGVTVESAGSIQLPASTSVGLTGSAAFEVRLPSPAPSRVTISLSSSDSSRVPSLRPP